jgi:RNA polymerase sigma factor (sigma-70 family)
VEGELSANDKAETSWNELHARFRAPLLAYFRNRIGDASEAEDLVQDVFSRLARQNEFSPTNVQAYIFVTAANLLKDRARNRAVRSASAHTSIDDSATKCLQELTEDRDPERVLAGKDTLREFLEGLEALNERTRDIFILARVEHMSQRDIARIFGISVSAVEKHIMKALGILGARLSR